MKALILITLLFSQTAFAKCWVLSLIDENGDNRIQCTRGFVPKNVIGPAPMDDTGKVLKQGSLLKPVLVEVTDYTQPIYTLGYEETCSAFVDATGHLEDDDADPETPDVWVEDTPIQPACMVQMDDVNFCQPNESKYNGYRTAPSPMPEGDSHDNYPQTTWCSALTYGTKEVTEYHFDPVKKAAAVAAQIASEAAVQSAKDAEAPFLAIEKKMACGRRVISMMAVSNEAKVLSRGQKIAQKNGMRDAMEFLFLGSLQEAKEEIELIVPDGVVTLQSDKDAAIAKLNECLGV